MQQNSDGGRYVDTETQEGDVVIYDSQNEQAWIQSDTTLDLPARK
jgi:spermidine synthase